MYEYDIRTDQGEKFIIRTGAIRLPWREQNPLYTKDLTYAEKTISYGNHEKDQVVKNREQILTVLRIRNVYTVSRIQKQQQKREVKKIRCQTFLCSHKI